MVPSAKLLILLAPLLCLASGFPGLSDGTNVRESGLSPGEELIDWAKENGAEVCIKNTTLCHTRINQGSHLLPGVGQETDAVCPLFLEVL
jgi:hypothetical protein